MRANRGVEARMFPIDRCAKTAHVREGFGITVAPVPQMLHKFAHGLDAGRKIERLLAPADCLANPGEVEQLHVASPGLGAVRGRLRVTASGRAWRMPARKYSNPV